MIERSLKGKFAVSVLQEDFNDIDVYVEDTAIESKKIYTELLCRVFNQEYKIDNIISLGPCNNVVKVWRENKIKNDGRLKVFIVDGDYHIVNDSICDFLENDEHNNHKGLFILPRYCIENYLIDFDAFIEIVHEETAVDERKAIRNTLNFDKWLLHNNQILKELFIYNSICMKYKVPERTSKYRITNLLSENSGYCCKRHVENRINYLKSKIEEKEKNINLNLEFKLRNEKVKDKTFISIVTGKDYLFPLIKNHVSVYYNCLNMSQISLKIRLAKICNISELYVLNESLI